MSVGVLAPDLERGVFYAGDERGGGRADRCPLFLLHRMPRLKRDLIEKYPRMLVERAVDGFLLLNTPARQDCGAGSGSGHLSAQRG